MNLSNTPRAALIILMLTLPILAQTAPVVAPHPPAMAKLAAELTAKHGDAIRPALMRGMSQVASLWRAEDGDPAEFESFVR